MTTISKMIFFGWEGTINLPVAMIFKPVQSHFETVAVT